MVHIVDLPQTGINRILLIQHNPQKKRGTAGADAALLRRNKITSNRRDGDNGRYHNHRYNGMTDGGSAVIPPGFFH